MRQHISIVVLIAALLLSACASCEVPEGYESHGQEFILAGVIDDLDGRGPHEEEFFTVRVLEDGSAEVTSTQGDAETGIVPPGTKFPLQVANQGNVWEVNLYIDCDGTLWVDPDDYAPPWVQT
jgi:hypothetical protein